MSSARFIPLMLLAFVLAAFLAQFGIDFNADNVAAATIVTASSLAMLLYLLWTPAIQTHPLSTFAIFGFCVTTQMGALLVQSATATSLVHHLRQPVATFATLALYQGVALVAHWLYRVFYRSPDMSRQPAPLFRSMLRALRLYTPPTVGALWIMGFLGLGSLLLGSGEGVISKVLQGISFLAWSPFLIPMFVAQVGPSYCNPRRHYLLLSLFAGALALFALAVNARGLMLSGLATVGLFALLRAMRSDKPVTLMQVGKVAVIGLLLGAISIPAADLVTAMVIARKDRGRVSALKMVENTLDIVQRPQLLQQQRALDRFVSLRDGYDEVYFASPLIGRLIETKFHDNALYFGSRLSERDERRVFDITGEFLWATLPEPWLKALDVNIDKKDLSFSMGDYIAFLGSAGGVGSFRTGSGLAQGLAIFGPGYFLVFFLFCPVLFLTVDVLAYRGKDGVVLISALGMLGIWKMFQYGISAESMQYLIQAVLRGLPQNLLLYLLVFHLASLIDRGLRGFVSPAPRRLLPSELA